MFVHGRGHRKTTQQRHYEKLREYTAKLEEYVEKIRICGEDRNSYSKTDHSASFRYSGAYSLLIQNFIPVHSSSLLISSKSVVILSNRRYLDFSVDFFHTQEYLFAFASNLEPSMYRCWRSTCSVSKIFLFGFMANGYISLRELEDQCKVNLRFMYLMDHQTPSYRTFGYFINEVLADSMRYMKRRLTLHWSSNSRNDI